MTFITGAISNSNPGPALYSAIETAALALGYTLVDTVVIGSNTHKVLKSAAAGNAQGLDWYLDINYPTTGTTGGMRFAPFEGYNASTHVATRGPYSGNSTTVDQTTYSAFGASTSALETNWMNSATYSSLSAVLSTSFTYYISITRDRILVELTSDAQYLTYSGFFTPTSAHSTAAGSALFPLVMTRMVAPTSTTTAMTTSFGVSTSLVFTRAPGAPTGSWFNWSASGMILVGATAFLGAGQLGGVGAAPFTSDQEFAPIPVIMGFNNTTFSTANAPSLVGYLKDVGVALGGSTVTMGNTVTVGSDTWYSTTQANGGVALLRGV